MLWRINWISHTYTFSGHGEYVFKSHKSAQDFIDSVSGSSVSVVYGIRYWTESKKAGLTA